MMQHSFFLCKCLHPADVGAVSDRPRAINNRPYEFYCRFCVFCNTPFYKAPLCKGSCQRS